MEKLTPRQKAFCEFYAASGNATEAALKAGYKVKTARSIGAENLTKPDIKEYLDELAREARSSRFLQIEERREILAHIARTGREVYDDKGNLDTGARQAAIKAIDTLNRMDGVYIQKQELNISVSDDFAAVIAAARERASYAERAERADGGTSGASG